MSVGVPKAVKKAAADPAAGESSPRGWQTSDGGDLKKLEARLAADDEECAQLVSTLGPLEPAESALLLDLLKGCHPQERDLERGLQFTRWLLQSVDRDQFLKRHTHGCLVRETEEGIEFEEHPTRADAVGLPFYQVRFVDGVYIPAHAARRHQPLDAGAPERAVIHAGEHERMAEEGQDR